MTMKFEIQKKENNNYEIGFSHSIQNNDIVKEDKTYKTKAKITIQQQIPLLNDLDYYVEVYLSKPQQLENQKSQNLIEQKIIYLANNEKQPLKKDDLFKKNYYFDMNTLIFDKLSKKIFFKFEENKITLIILLSFYESLQQLENQEEKIKVIAKPLVYFTLEQNNDLIFQLCINYSINYDQSCELLDIPIQQFFEYEQSITYYNKQNNKTEQETSNLFIEVDDIVYLNYFFKFQINEAELNKKLELILSHSFVYQIQIFEAENNNFEINIERNKVISECLGSNLSELQELDFIEIDQKVELDNPDKKIIIKEENSYNVLINPQHKVGKNLICKIPENQQKLQINFVSYVKIEMNLEGYFELLQKELNFELRNTESNKNINCSLDRSNIDLSVFNKVIIVYDGEEQQFDENKESLSQQKKKFNLNDNLKQKFQLEKYDENQIFNSQNFACNLIYDQGNVYAFITNKNDVLMLCTVLVNNKTCSLIYQNEISDCLDNFDFQEIDDEFSLNVVDTYKYYDQSKITLDKDSIQCLVKYDENFKKFFTFQSLNVESIKKYSNTQENTLIGDFESFKQKCIRLSQTPETLEELNMLQNMVFDEDQEFIISNILDQNSSDFKSQQFNENEKVLLKISQESVKSCTYDGTFTIEVQTRLLI